MEVKRVTFSKENLSKVFFDESTVGEMDKQNSFWI